MRAPIGRRERSISPASGIVFLGLPWAVVPGCSFLILGLVEVIVNEVGLFGADLVERGAHVDIEMAEG